MKGTSVNEKVKVKNSQVKTGERAETGATMAIATGAMFAVGGVAALVGAWAVISFFSGLFAAGGPISLFTSWVSALAGL